ncbi:conserved hypothetical protein [Ferroglobus placidus DSM 10642]|uniref:Metallo-beta-lactamase domain-containing protein n=1 Tax=Ferroglobus placidus (strain DSM 10642 / AEDII12DO) TaxID=589924 RepID=D3RZL3_FERPA|nr:MBL fold metallo-hydrolase [Ferroglobus placidus]ADC65926.1 conserved hypothetical protein [Ferroglobus placidus DSM 10642]
MLKVEKIEDVEKVEMGTEINGVIFLTTCAYVYSDMVFDSGCSNARKEFRDFVIRRNLDDLSVYLTHFHEDHAGNAELFNLIRAGEETKKILVRGYDVPPYRKAVWGDFEPLRGKNIEEPDVDFIEAPGHSHDHLVYFIDDYAFVGDLVVTMKPQVSFVSEKFVQIIDSIENLLKRDFEVAFGGHGVFSREEVEGYLAYLKNLREECLELYEKGLSFIEIYERVIGKPSNKAMMFETFSSGEWSRERLIKSLISVLQVE